MPTKVNGSGGQQEYVPAGNGDASGEYGDSQGSNVHFKSFAKPNLEKSENVFKGKILSNIIIDENLAKKANDNFSQRKYEENSKTNDFVLEMKNFEDENKDLIEKYPEFKKKIISFEERYQHWINDKNNKNIKYPSALVVGFAGISDNGFKSENSLMKRYDDLMEEKENLKYWQPPKTSESTQNKLNDIQNEISLGKELNKFYSKGNKIEDFPDYNKFSEESKKDIAYNIKYSNKPYPSYQLTGLNSKAKTLEKSLKRFSNFAKKI